MPPDGTVSFGSVFSGTLTFRFRFVGFDCCSQSTYGPVTAGMMRRLLRFETMPEFHSRMYWEFLNGVPYKQPRSRPSALRRKQECRQAVMLPIQQPRWRAGRWKAKT